MVALPVVFWDEDEYQEMENNAISHIQQGSSLNSTFAIQNLFTEKYKKRYIEFQIKNNYKHLSFFQFFMKRGNI